MIAIKPHSEPQNKVHIEKRGTFGTDDFKDKS